MRGYSSIATAATFLGVLALEGAAHAGGPNPAPPIRPPAPPPACTATIDARQYNTGFLIGQRIVQSAVLSINSCDEIDFFVNVILDNVARFTLPRGASNALACRYAGQVEGVIQEMDNQARLCDDQCFADGQVIGEISAAAYCELSILLGGLAEPDAFVRRPTLTCGFNFEVGCDSSFIGVSRAYENAFGQCLPFTQDPFFEVWDQTRINQCAYDPETDPTAE